MNLNHDALFYHRNLADQFSTKLGLSPVAAALGFKSFAESHLKLNLDLDLFEDEYQEQKDTNTKAGDITDHSFELFLILMTQDKSYSLKYVERAFDFFSDTLGMSYDIFSEYCFSSERILKSFLPENVGATDYEKMFAFFYCMFVHGKTDRRFNISEVHFLSSFADYLGIELENSNLWISFREYEDTHQDSLLKALSLNEKKCAFMAIIAMVMGGTKDFDPEEKKLLQKYFSLLNMTKDDLGFLRSKPQFHIAELMEQIAPEDFPFLLTAIVEAVFADGKIDLAESEIVANICRRKDSFKVLPCHLLKLYSEVITHAKGLKESDAAHLETICDLFSQSVPDESVRGQLFFLAETFYNLKTETDLSAGEIESCLRVLKFSPSKIPEIVDLCTQNIKGTNSQIQTLAYVESLHCLKNSEIAQSESLLVLLKKVLGTTPLNKMKMFQLTLSFVLSDKKLSVFDNTLLEDLSLELGLHREELRPVIFFMSLASGERAGTRIKFRGE